MNNRNWNYVIISILLVFFAGKYICAQDGDSPQTSYKLITIASEPDYPPYCLVDKKGNADGFSIDLFKEAISTVGLKANIKIGIWNQIKKDLEEGRIDALPLVGRTPEREALFDFTLPYISLHGAVFVRKGTSGINKIDDLKEKEIAVMKGDNAEEFLRREQISDFIITTNTFQEAFRLLANGECDAVITQRITGIKLLETIGIENVIPLIIRLPGFRQDFCFAVKKGNEELRAQLNEGLSIIIADGRYDMIHQKWFGPAVKETMGYKDYLKFAIYFIIPLFIFLALFSIVFLRREVRNRTFKLLAEVSEHRKTLNTLQEQKQLLNEMEKISMVGGWEYDSRSSLFTLTSGVYAIYGIAPEAYKSMDRSTLMSFYTQEDQVTLNTAFNHALSTGESFDLELQLNSAVGEKRWVRIKGNPELINETVERIRGSVLDVTERKQAEQSIRESEMQLRQTMDFLENLIHYANAPIIVWNRKFEIERFNKAFEQLTGKMEDEVLGQNIELIFPPHTKEEAPHLLERTLHGERWKNVEIDIQHKDGSFKTVLWNSANISTAEETEIIATIAMGQDITDRKKAEEGLFELSQNLEKKVSDRTLELESKVKELDESQKAMLYMVEDLNSVTAALKNESKKLELSNQELEAFSYSVSHDLRAPLRAIDGFSRFLIEDYHHKLDTEGKRLLKVIKDNAVKMDKLISDLLNLSRISRAEMKYSKVDMEAMAVSMYHEIATEDEKKSFTLLIEKMPTIDCDSTLMKLVWQNLLGNALKYSSKSRKKKIVISNTESDHMHIFSIKDHGVGFDPTYTGKLFKVFQRLHREDEFPGTGVGLSIVQRIIHRHGGQTWAEGEINKGATFFFSLPKYVNKENI